MAKKEPLEQLPTTRVGDRVVRRQRRHRGRLLIIFKAISRLFKSITRK